MNLKNVLFLVFIFMTSFVKGQEVLMPFSSQSHEMEVVAQQVVFLEDQSSVYSDSVAVAQENNIPWFVEKFRVSAGIFKMFNNGSFKIDSSLGFGTEVNLENDLGFNESSNTFMGDFEWRSSQRSRFNLSYYNSKRRADHQLNRTLEIGDGTYDLNSNIYAYFNSELWRFSYGYALISKPKYEAGLLVGTHTMFSKIGIGIQGTSINFELNKNYNVTAPLLDFGIWGGYALSDDFAVKGEINYFQLQIKNVGGSILGYNFSVVYKASKNLEFSTGVSGLNFEVTAVNTLLETNIKWGYNGMTLLACYTFGTKKWK